ncbi:protein GAPT [Echinops telfairi]|uniref:Protein GAPT n=1 Tax=Echinops telfairi TaxID=9371 RepID=A0ABM0ZQP0_ECHTE|nr:protein GAPT [Echinops telfairi]
MVLPTLQLDKQRQPHRGEILKSSGHISMAFPLGIFLLLLLMFCVIGCVWQWRHPNRNRFVLPKVLQRRRSKKNLYAKKFFLSPQEILPQPKTSVQTQDHKSTTEVANIHGNYENVEACPVNAKEEASKEIYENTRQSNFEEHIYGNELSPKYFNFQQPSTSDTPQDEDIYILPDAY